MAAWQVELADERATAVLASDIAVMVERGDAVALSGALGTGKTAFARAFLRNFTGDPGLEVPSPTFTLIQAYDGGRLPAAHIDLYRIAGDDEAGEIGLERALDDGIALVEWPERAPARLPPARWEVALDLVAGDAERRNASIGGTGTVAPRLARTAAIRRFLDGAGHTGAERRYVQGDASSRRYERIDTPAGSRILMDWPSAGPPPADSHAVRVKRAWSVDAFMALAEGLRAAGLSVPAVTARDRDLGLLLLEDFGSDTLLTAEGAPDPERYGVVAEALAHLHGAQRPRALPVAGGGSWELPDLDAGFLLGEVGVFLSDGPAAVGAAPVAPDDAAAFEALWRDLADRVLASESGWVLRDVHSPNLLWLGERQGIARAGFLDFQDALIGPTAYDMVSLCQDARVTVDAATEAALKERYAAARGAAGGFDRAAFDSAYAILGAQRAMRLIGQFRWLAGARHPRYLAHIPRMEEYLVRNLAHPVLSALALWYETAMKPGSRDR